MNEVDRQFQFFLDNQDELVLSYDGKIIVVQNNSVKGAFDSTLDAYLYGKRNFELGTFIVQKCISGPEAYTTVISTPGAIVA